MRLTTPNVKAWPRKPSGEPQRFGFTDETKSNALTTAQERQDHTAAAQQIGDCVVAYINQLGRMEGQITRQLQNGFAFKVAAPPRKIEKLAARIAWLVQRDVFGVPDNRRQERVEAEDGQIIVTTPDGEEHVATLIDVSSEGAAMSVAIAPPIGSPVTVGQRRARVVRHFAGGVAVKFQNFLRLRQRSRDPEYRNLQTLVNRPYLMTPPAVA